MTKGFGIIPNIILYDKKLSYRAKILFTIISSLSSLKGYCFANNKFLAEKMNTSISSIQRMLKELRPYILIKISKRVQRKISIKDSFQIPHVKIDTPPMSKLTYPHVKIDTPKVPFSRLKHDPNNIIYINKYNNNITAKEKNKFKDYEKSRADSEFSHSKIQQLKRELMEKIKNQHKK